MEKIIFFNGSNKEFKKFLIAENVKEDEISFRDLVMDTENRYENDSINNLIIHSSDFLTVKEHVFSNFNGLILKEYKIKNSYIQNAPKRVIDNIKDNFNDEIIFIKNYKYFVPEIEDVVSFYNKMKESDDVIGQQSAKENAAIGLFKNTYKNKSNPTIMMFYGPSGVGKTELAKEISTFFKGNLTRIQFSMMQTEKAYKYLFGDSNNEESLAQDLLLRESNVILLDEFDKVNQGLYNVFYQMFDEGIFEDNDYKVDLSNCIFILTSNFNSEEDMIKNMGMPIYSRINSKIKFEYLSNQELNLVVENIFNKIINELSEKDANFIKDSYLLNFYKSRVNNYDNVRLLSKEIENDVYKQVFKNKLNM